MQGGKETHVWVMEDRINRLGSPPDGSTSSLRRPSAALCIIQPKGLFFDSLDHPPSLTKKYHNVISSGRKDRIHSHGLAIPPLVLDMLDIIARPSIQFASDMSRAVGSATALW